MLNWIVAESKSTDKVMAKAAVDKWKSYYGNQKKMENYLLELYLLNTKENAVLRETERRSGVTSLATILMDPNYDYKENLYRWREVGVGKEKKNMLQLNVGGNLWVDWLYLARSGVKIGDEGLFAARDFLQFYVVGFYSGAVVWETEMQGGGKPSEEELADVKMNEYCLPVRDRDCRMLIVDPVSIPDKSLRMGIHYVRETNDKTKSNVMLIEDGSLQCSTDIKCDTELLLFSEEALSEQKPAAQIVDSAVAGTEAVVGSVLITRSAKKRKRSRKRKIVKSSK